jgi:hypothetical protein
MCGIVHVMKTRSGTYKEIIDEGQEMMRNSLDSFHSYVHAQYVEDTALKVYEELRAKGYKDIDRVTPELVKVAAWWHDCYKSRLSEFSVASNFSEGIESGKIIRDSLSSRMRPEDLELLVEAVENHAGSSLFPYFFLNRTKSPLHKILLEADAHDLPNIERVAAGYTSLDSIGRTLWTVVDILEVLVLPLYLRTKTSRNKVFSRMWRFWGAWLWKEKYFWKALARQLRSN